MGAEKFDFSGGINKAWEIYKANLLLLVGASLVGSLLISVTAGILAGPLSAGLMLLVLKMVDGREDAKFDDLFSAFSKFFPTFLLMLAWGIAFYIVYFILMMIPVVGYIAGLLLSFAFSPFIMFAVVLAVEKELSFGEASKESFSILKNNFGPLVGFTAVGSLLSGLGVLACGVGALITMPFSVVVLAVAYRHFVKSTATVEHIEEPVVEGASEEKVETDKTE